MAYTKLHQSLVTSTVWREPHATRIVWITMLAMADKNGEIQASIPGLADLCRVSLEDCETALNAFLSPDKYSRTKDFEGRRIQEIDGGWALLNHPKYRAMASKEDATQKASERTARYRRNKALQTVDSRDVSTVNRDIADTDTDTDTDTEADTSTLAPLAVGFAGEVSAKVRKVFTAWQDEWGKPRAKLDKKRTALISARLKDYTADDLVEAIKGYKFSKHHCGLNDRNTVYDEIGLFLRDSAHVDAGLKFASEADRAGQSQSERKNAVATADWTPPEMRRGPQ
jgi:hypothetical protein